MKRGKEVRNTGRALAWCVAYRSMSYRRRSGRPFVAMCPCSIPRHCLAVGCALGARADVGELPAMLTTLTSGCRTIWEKSAQVHHTPSTKAHSSSTHRMGTRSRHGLKHAHVNDKLHECTVYTIRTRRHAQRGHTERRPEARARRGYARGAQGAHARAWCMLPMSRSACAHCRGRGNAAAHRRGTTALRETDQPARLRRPTQARRTTRRRQARQPRAAARSAPPQHPRWVRPRRRRGSAAPPSAHAADHQARHHEAGRPTHARARPRPPPPPPTHRAPMCPIFLPALHRLMLPLGHWLPRAISKPRPVWTSMTSNRLHFWQSLWNLGVSAITVSENSVTQPFFVVSKNGSYLGKKHRKEAVSMKLQGKKALAGPTGCAATSRGPGEGLFYPAVKIQE